MSDGDLTTRSDKDDHPRRQDLDPGRDQRTYDRKGISAGKVLNWLVLILVLVALAVLAYGIAREFFPRRWAEEIVAVVDGNRVRGLNYGFGIGFVFTLIPLLILAQTRRRFFNWTWRLILLVVALIVAAPNWLTVAVALGNSKSAVDGRILLTQSGPGFRDGSAAGAILGFVIGVLLVGFSMRLSQRRRQVSALKAKVSDLEKRVVKEPDHGRWRAPEKDADEHAHKGADKAADTDADKDASPARDELIDEDEGIDEAVHEDVDKKP